MWLMKDDINEISCAFIKEETAFFGYDYDKIIADIDTDSDAASGRVSTFIKLILTLLVNNKYCEAYDKIPMQAGFDICPDHIVLHFYAYMDEDVFPFEGEKEINVRSLVPANINQIAHLLWNDYQVYGKKHDVSAFYFKKIDDVINYTVAINNFDGIKSSLYRSKDNYCLICDFDDANEQKTAICKNIATEWCFGMKTDNRIETYMEEHEDCIIKDNAMECLKQIN